MHDNYLFAIILIFAYDSKLARDVLLLSINLPRYFPNMTTS